MRKLSTLTICLLLIGLALACRSNYSPPIQYEEVQILDVKLTFEIEFTFKVGETPSQDTTYAGALMTLLPSEGKELEAFCGSSIISNKDDLDALRQLSVISKVKVDTTTDPWEIIKIYK